ncbi:MAG: DUF1902 domain-containing protein [Candidatus Accumulibacter sp.]|nr:DUF1902 domain-containing protein [Accumulibacter sp.]
MPESSLSKQPDVLNPPLLVSVTYADGFYTAICDDLHLVTEAETLDALRDRVWELAPELVELNALPVDSDSLRFSFDMHTLFHAAPETL